MQSVEPTVLDHHIASWGGGGRCIKIRPAGIKAMPPSLLT
jgi:hypothetical protein